MPKLTREQVREILALDAAERRRRTEEILAAAGHEYSRDVDDQILHAQISAEFEQRVQRRSAGSVDSGFSPKVAAIREAEARRLREASPPEEFDLRPLVEKALAKSRSADPGDAAAEVIKQLRFEQEKDALAAAIRVACYVVNDERSPFNNGPAFPGMPTDW